MSQKTVRQNYIQADVFSATPQKLQLLLVEAAMKNVLRTKKFWEEGNISDAFDTLTRAQDIVAEILCSLDVEGSPDIAKKLASIYVFIFRRLTEAGMNQNIEKLDDAYRVLCSERETWKLVCEKFGSSKTEGAISSVGQTAPTPQSQTARSGSATYVPSPVSASGVGTSAPATGTFALPPKPLSVGQPSIVGPTPNQPLASKSLGGVSVSSLNFSSQSAQQTTIAKSVVQPQSNPLQSNPLQSPASQANPLQLYPLQSNSLQSSQQSVIPQKPMSPPPVVSSVNPAFKPILPAMPFPGPAINLSVPTKPSSSTQGIPLGQIDLLNPLGQFSPPQKSEPMSNPPQNANVSKDPSNTSTLKSPIKPIPITLGTKSSFSWEG